MRGLGSIGGTMFLAASCSAPRTPSSDEPSPAQGHVVLTPAQAETLLCEALQAYDCDEDTRITELDAARCPGAFATPIKLPTGATASFDHLYQWSQYTQTLARIATQEAAAPLDLAEVRQSPALTLGQRIEDQFWDRLTRVIDPDDPALWRVALDPKVAYVHSAEPRLCANRGEDRGSVVSPLRGDTRVHLYVPADDPTAIAAFSRSEDRPIVEVHALPLPVPPLELTHGLLTLGLDRDGRGRPYVVPGGRFNELYGWDSFFIVLGLLESPRRIELARSIVDNLVYEVEHYGKVLNANRTYYLTRSQPPFLPAMILAVSAALPEGAATAAWRDHAMEVATREYATVWSADPRVTALCRGEVCLSRYFGEGRGQPPEVEPGHFTWFYQHYARTTGRCDGAGGTLEERRAFVACAAKLEDAYRGGTLVDPQIDEFFLHDRAMRESGHDTTFRWYRGDDPVPDRAADFATVDLNALLLRAELDFARWRADTQGDPQPWCLRARARAASMREFLYDESQGLFFDFDVARGERSPYLSATTLFPLWAIARDPCEVGLLSREEKARLVEVALDRLECSGGLCATDAASLARVQRPISLRAQGEDVVAATLDRQWDYPNGWAPHQMIAWEALRAHGFAAEAERLAYRWLFTIVRNAALYHGTVPEKYDVVARTHRVFAEYGNVNAESSYIATEGFGWMNASYVVGWEVLGPDLRDALAREGGPEPRFDDAR